MKNHADGRIMLGAVSLLPEPTIRGVYHPQETISSLLWRVTDTIVCPCSTTPSYIQAIRTAPPIPGRRRSSPELCSK
jgi:hypothetical protein